MKKVAKEPRLLPNVMEAIAYLKERNGSTQQQIIDQITRSLRTQRNRSVNVKVQVRRALEHGLHSGLIKQRSGKFRLGLGKQNYKVFKKLTRLYHPTYESKRRPKRRRRPRRGRRRSKSRRRRYSTDEEDETDGNTDTDRSFTKSPEPQDKSRKRRKSRRKGRRSRRRYRRRGADSDEVDSDRSSPTNQGRSGQSEEKRSDQDKLNYQSKSGTSQMQHDQNQQEQPQEEDDDCGNPDCLCNIKQEDGSSRNSTRDNYFHQSYLN